MTDNNDTEQPVPLPLMERVRLGLRIEETELTPEQIAELEFPKDSVGQTWWRGQIEQAIKAGALAAHVEKTVTVIRGGVRLTKKYRDGVLVPGSQVVSSVSTSGHHQDITRERYLVPRDAYAGWRTGAAVFRKQPDACIDLWLPLFPILAPAKATPVSVRTVLPEMADYLPLREQARLGYLPDALHVEQIATLQHPDNLNLALAYAKVLINACENRELTSLGKPQYQDWWLEDGSIGEVSKEFQWWYKKLELGELGPTQLIDKIAYRDWLLQKGLPLPIWWFPTFIHSSTPKNISSIPEIMNQPGSQLSLAERAKRGLLSNEFELWLQEIMELEFPALTSYEDRQRLERVNWQKSIEVAIQYGMLGGCQQQAAVQSQTHYYRDARRAYFSGPREKAIHVVGCSDWRVPREPYRAWRATQPNPPAGSIIHLWLGAAPASSVPTLPQSEPDKPGSGAAAKSETELQMHRRECQAIGKRLWAENPNSTKAYIMKHRDMLFYVQTYKGKNTVPGWLAEIDPRPKDKRRGRPKKIPV